MKAEILIVLVFACISVFAQEEVSPEASKLAALKTSLDELLSSMGASTVEEAAEMHMETSSRLVAIESELASAKAQYEQAVSDADTKVVQYRSELELLKTASGQQMDRVQGELSACESKPVPKCPQCPECLDCPECPACAPPPTCPAATAPKLQECSLEFLQAYESCSNHLIKTGHAHGVAAGYWVLQATIAASDMTLSACRSAWAYTMTVAMPATVDVLDRASTATTETATYVFSEFVEPTVGPPYREHVKVHVSSVVDKTLTVYSMHVAPVLFPLMSYTAEMMHSGAYWLYDNLFHERRGVVGAVVARAIDALCDRLSTMPLVKARYSARTDLRTFAVFCIVLIVTLVALVSSITHHIFMRRKPKPTLTRSFSYGA